MKFTFKGSITIKAEYKRLGLHKRSVKFSVIDTGVGISRKLCQEMKKIFKSTEKLIELQMGKKAVKFGLSVANFLAKKLNSCQYAEDESIEVGIPD